MTIEVVAMNAFGAALAADSAICHSRDGLRSSIIHANASKIFDLTYRGGPAGGMVHGAMSLEGSPWGSVFAMFDSMNRPASSLIDLAHLLAEYLMLYLSGQGYHPCSRDSFLGTRVIECIESTGSTLDLLADDDTAVIYPFQFRRHSASSRQDRLAQAIGDESIVPCRDPLDLAEEATWPAMLVDERQRRDVEAALRRYLARCQFAGIVLVGYDYDDPFPQAIELTLHRHGARICIETIVLAHTTATSGSALLSFAMDEEVRAFREGLHPGIVPPDFEDRGDSANGFSQTLISLLDTMNSLAGPGTDPSGKLITEASLAVTESVTNWEAKQAAFSAEIDEGLTMFPLQMLPWVARLQVELGLLRAALSTHAERQVSHPIREVLISRETGFTWIDSAGSGRIPRPR